MMRRKNWLLPVMMLFVVLALSGCNLFDGDQPEDLEGLVETYTAQTQAAQNQIGTIVAGTLAAMPTAEEKSPGEAVITEETPVQQPTHTATATLLPTATPTLAPTPTDTPAGSIVYAQVSVPTNCRTGPGKVFDKVSVLNVGKQVEVVARNAFGTYWVVKNPAGAGTCWLWGTYATVSGPTAHLPVWDSPPTPTPVSGVAPTLAAVTLKVSVPTNCRVGPGLAYDKVTILQPGKTVKVVARHASADFWVIENPTGEGTCWVWGAYASFTGLPGSLPVQAPPPTPTPQAGLTPTPTVVTLKVSVDTNCRVGPGKPYDIVTIFKIGQTAKVVGRHATADYWVIENPAGEGTCWVWGEYATLSGSGANLPVWDVPPAPTPTPVTLKVSVDTNCRTGPGKPYDIVTIFRIGKTADVVARNAANTYWVIRNPEGSGQCWVWGKYATLTGPAESLPIWDPPATPTPKP
jgi:uncharacterized protein YgiM (DUF1202 family)